MNIVDAVIIVLLIVGFLAGFRRGAIKQAVTLIGLVLVIVGAYYLKNPIAMFCYKTFPFIDFKIFNGVSVVNILFYEVISFIVAASILTLILRIVLKISGIIEKVFDATIILGFFSKLIGGALGVIEAYVISFVLLFFFSQPFINVTGVGDSKIGTYMLNNTPVLTNAVSGTIDVIEELYNMKDDYNNKDFEKKAVEKFLDYKVIDVKALKVLRDKNKINFSGINELIIEYGG